MVDKKLKLGYNILNSFSCKEFWCLFSGQLGLQKKSLEKSLPRFAFFQSSDHGELVKQYDIFLPLCLHGKIHCILYTQINTLKFFYCKYIFCVCYNKEECPSMLLFKFQIKQTSLNQYCSLNFTIDIFYCNDFDLSFVM